MAAPLTITSTIRLNNGMDMPVFGLGTWRSEPGKVTSAVLEALKAGYVHLDCAAVYRNQEEVAAGLKAAQAAGIPRERVFITSKVWNTAHRPEHVRPAVEKILRELGLDSVELMLIHWPTAFAAADDAFPRSEPDADGNTRLLVDEGARLADTWAALEACVDAGLVKAIGVSNFSTAEVDEVLRVARIKPVMNQVELHPYLNQAALRADMAARGIAITAYSPLGNVDPASLPCCLDDEVIGAIAAKRGKTPAQVIIRWGLQLGSVVIPKSVTAARIVENADVFDFELSAEEMAQIDALGARNVRMVNPPFRAGGAPVFE